MTTTLISGGLVITSQGCHHADVLVDGERISALVEPDSAVRGQLVNSVDRIIDATGCYVIPGAVDAHTHMEMPFGGTQASDTFESGTRAAAFGGTTSIIDFAVQRQGERVQDSLDAWHQKAAGNCAIDYGFHQIIGGVDDASLAAMDGLIAEGVTSFKLFMAYPGVFYSDDGQILQAMQRSASNGSMIMMHAENGPVIDVLVQQALARRLTAPIHHGLTRPWETEAEATNRAIMLAKITGASLYIVHMSAQQAVETLAQARNDGLTVFGETCPQYLYLSLEEQLGAAGFDGAKWVCSTPLRSRAEGHQEQLWKYLRTDALSVVSTDHCPFCMKGQKELGINDFSKIPNGIGSVEHRLDLLYQGVVTGQLTLERWVDICCTTPARIFGMTKKGVLMPGADADIVIYDPQATTTISAKTHHMNMDYSAWEGFTVDGGVRTVFSRGTQVVDRGTFTGTIGHGKFVKRELAASSTR